MNTIDRLIRGAYAVGAAIMVLLGALIMLDVLMRSVFASPITSVDDVVAYALVLFTFLQLPLMVREHHLLRVTLLTERLGVHAQRGLFVFCLAVGAAIFTILACISIGPTYESYIIGEFQGAGAIRIPVWMIRLAVTALLALAALASLAAMMGVLRGEDTLRSEARAHDL
jgi:TRAP-type C4-dicarboxylate transport system permease small subunit